MLGVTAHSASKPDVMDALLRSFTSVMSKSDAVSAKSATSSVRPFVSVPETNRKPEPDPDPSPSPPKGRVRGTQSMVANSRASQRLRECISIMAERR